MFFIVACEFILSMPPMDGIIFSRLLVLEPTQQPIARDALLYCIPMNILFILRNPYQVSLYLARNSLAANLATIGRIVATLILATLFVKINFVGHYAGIIALTIPLAAECYMIRQLGRPYLKMLPEGQPGESPVREQLFFCTPLSFGSILLGLSGFMVAAFVSRAPEPIRMLPIHYISLGIVNPLAFAAMRMQAVVLSFPPKDRHASQTFVFSIIAGLTLAGITLIGQIPPVARYYFGKLQNLPAEDIKLAMRVIMIVSLKPLISALRGHAEGLAAWRRRPNATLAGQAVNLATLVCSLFVFLNLGVPGYMMGALADICAGLATFLTIRMGVAWSEFENRTIDYSTNFSERS
jgi:hypothetical protein